MLATSSNTYMILFIQWIICLNHNICGLWFKQLKLTFFILVLLVSFLCSANYGGSYSICQGLVLKEPVIYNNLLKIAIGDGDLNRFNK